MVEENQRVTSFFSQKNEEENPLPAVGGRAFLLRKNKEDEQWYVIRAQEIPIYR